MAMSRITIASYVLAALALVAILELELLSALLAGLLVYSVVELTAPAIRRAVGMKHHLAQAVVLAFFVVLIMLAIAAAVVGLMSLLTNGSESLAPLLQKLAEAVDAIRGYLPAWAQAYIPDNLGALEQLAAGWLREHAGNISNFGRSIGTFMVHVLVGMVVGGMVVFQRETKGINPGPLTHALGARIATLNNVFRRIVFAQVRISAINTILTGVYLVILLPILGIHLPFVKTMVLVTFIVGLLPIIGNLISNTMIVLISLQASFLAALISLVFLVLIHKLEYFVNARIVGTQINARAWELLIALLVMESAFGIPGLIAAPIYYAYLKDEMAAAKLI